VVVLLGGGLAGLIVLAGCASAPAANGSAAGQVVRPDETIMDLVRADPEMAKLEAALTAADLDGTLEMEDEPYTLFAPTDEAFASLPEGQFERWMLIPLDIREVMLYHVVNGTFSAAEFREGEVLGVQTFQGEQLSINFGADPAHRPGKRYPRRRLGEERRHPCD
jgi:uncharacterized surface protein with fasciclin (FAS1) repeats